MPLNHTTMDILGFTLTQAVTFVLVLARVGGIFMVGPVFGNANVSPYVRIGIAAALAFVFLPMAHTSVSGPDRSASPEISALGLNAMTFVLVIAKEVAVGLVIGFLAAMMFAALQMAGAYVDLQVGFGFANVVDPMIKQHNAVIAQLYNLCATLLFLAINGHHLMIRGLADSFAVLPLGGMTMAPEATAGVMRLFTTLFVAALKIGAPVVGAIFLTDVALGILARTVPQLNVFVVGLPAKLTVGMLAVFAVMPAAFVVMSGLFGGLERDLIRLLRYVGG